MDPDAGFSFTDADHFFMDVSSAIAVETNTHWRVALHARLPIVDHVVMIETAARAVWTGAP